MKNGGMKEMEETERKPLSLEEIKIREKESAELLKTCVTEVEKLKGDERTFIGKVVGIRAHKHQFEEGVDTVTITLFLETDFTEKLVPIRLRYSESPKSRYGEFLKALKACKIKISSLGDLKEQKFEWSRKMLTYEIGGEVKESELLIPIKYIKE